MEDCIQGISPKIKNFWKCQEQKKANKATLSCGILENKGVFGMKRKNLNFIRMPEIPSHSLGKNVKVVTLCLTKKHIPVSIIPVKK